MPTKAELYSQLASDTAHRLTGNWERWADFLSLAGRLYKYPYSAIRISIAQRPDATACAEYDVWNNRMNRFVRRGAKGIALLDDSGGTPHLRYVFDVSDTGTRRNSLDPDLWQMDYSFREPVAEMLAKTYGVSDPNFAQQLADLSGKLVEDYWDNNAQDIRDIVDGSLLEGYDDLNLEMEFKSAGAISITWLLLSRCGIDPEGWFDRRISRRSIPSAPQQPRTSWERLSRRVAARCCGRSREPSRPPPGAEMQKGAKNMSSLTYSQNGDYLIPNLVLDPAPAQPLGKYGRMRKAYLKERRPLIYNQMLLSGSLFPHLQEVDETAHLRLEQMMLQLAKDAGATEALKAENPMKWVGLMNTCKVQAEEILMKELINN